MNKEKEWINEHFNGLSDGESASGSCCGRCYRMEVSGDRPSECHLTVSRDGSSLLYNCFGAKCGVKGVAKIRGARNFSANEHHIRSDKPKGKLRGKHNEAVPLPNSFERKLSQPARQWVGQYDITEQEIAANDIGIDSYSGRVIFPVWKDGEKVGFASRRIVEDGTRKWYNHVPKGTIYQPASLGREGHVQGIIVEAPPSAIKLQSLAGFPTIALMGSVLSEAKIHEVRSWAREHNLQEIVIALDPDALDKARKVKKQLTSRICKSRVVVLDKKPKELTAEELKEIVG